MTTPHDEVGKSIYFRGKEQKFIVPTYVTDTLQLSFLYNIITILNDTHSYTYLSIWGREGGVRQTAGSPNPCVNVCVCVCVERIQIP